MKTQCPHCSDIFTIPDEYVGKQLKCVRCKLLFTPKPFSPHVVESKHLATKGSDLITRLWKNTPKLFKVGFLSTLGVLSACFLAFFIYGHLVVRPLPSSPLVEAKALLSRHSLFPMSLAPQRNILRGRYLSEYRFFPDANRDWPYLSLWTDDTDILVGISAFWYSIRHGAPTYVVDVDDNTGLRWYARNNSIYEGFVSLIDSDLSTVPYSIETYKERGCFLCEKSFNKWRIHFIWSPTLRIGSDYHYKQCEFDAIRTGEPVDPNVYELCVTAIRW